MNHSPHELQEENALASLIDHTLLQPMAGLREVQALVDEAVTYEFASVCVHPCRIRDVREPLKNRPRNGVEPPKICTVVGFPLGANTTETKVSETRQALEQGAQEIDCVINLGDLADGRIKVMEKELQALRDITSRAGACLKVIIESGLLSDQQIKLTSQLAVNAGADFVKTSTGFNGPGASVAAVRLIRSTIGDRAGIKASGGIRTQSFALELREAGATRLGCSRSVAILKGEDPK